jgi:hypothetical protein
MAGGSRWLQKRGMTFQALGVAVACAGAMACGGGGGGSPSSPSGGGGGLPAGASCRTAASSMRSVQQFTDGTNITTTSDMTCTYNPGNNDVVCSGTYTDTSLGTGTITQTTRFLSKADIVDEVAVIPPRPLSPGTTTVIAAGGASITTTATNTYDSQRRLMSTRTVTPIAAVGEITTMTTFNGWDLSGRPTTGSITFTPGGSNPVSYTYDSTNRTVTRNTGLNTCTVTHDQNGNMTREVCTGTQPSTTTVTINSTQQICK